MTAYRFVQIACDGNEGACDEELTDSGAASLVRDELKRGGWIVGAPGGKDYCPRHRPDEHPAATP